MTLPGLRRSTDRSIALIGVGLMILTWTLIVRLLLAGDLVAALAYLPATLTITAGALRLLWLGTRSWGRGGGGR